MSIERTMRDEANKEFEEMGKMKLGSEEHVKTANVANTTVDRLNEIEKINIEHRKLDIEEQKIEIEKKKLENDKKNNLVRYVLTGAIFVVSTGVTIWANIDSKRFEGSFTHTTASGRNSERKLLSLLDKVRIF